VISLTPVTNNTVLTKGFDDKSFLVEVSTGRVLWQFSSAINEPIVIGRALVGGRWDRALGWWAMGPDGRPLEVKAVKYPIKGTIGMTTATRCMTDNRFVFHFPRKIIVLSC
jgi:hypothetical protein